VERTQKQKCYRPARTGSEKLLCQVQYEKENGSCRLSSHSSSLKVGGLVWLICHQFFFFVGSHWEAANQKLFRM